MSTGNQSAPALSSPCTGVCQVDLKTRLCTGCLRSIEEITVWSKLPEAERQSIMAALPHRRNRPAN